MFEDGQQKKLSHILSQAKYMNQLINTVLDSRKLEEGFGVLNIASYRLEPWIEGVCNEFRSEFESKSMTLSCEVSPDTAILNFDENKFKIILSNLLMNAWKYSEEGTKVCIRTSSSEGIVRISVIDEGIGISEADAEKIFDRFTQSDRALIRDKFRSAAENITIQESTFSNADEKFLTELDAFIDANISNDRLNAQMIIDHTCMGRATFYKKIKEVTGLGIMEYVTRKRMTKAAELLFNTQLPISDIAQKSGYSDNQYFSKVFRQHFNMSPNSYRNRPSRPDEQ